MLDDLLAVEYAFDRDVLAKICTMPEEDFASEYGMVTVHLPEVKTDENFFHYLDNGSTILAVAHLDTVGARHEREAHYVQTEGGEVIFSRALDDRLGAYVILDMLPKLGINVDVLLTVGEESGCSTAEHFSAPKEYQWMIEFDRGGTDVVMYQYEDAETVALVKKSGARVGDGSYSDISYLEHLEIKGFNWGVGYRDYHGPRAHAYLDDTFSMVEKFIEFHRQNEDVYLPHETLPSLTSNWWGGYSGSRWDNDAWIPAEQSEGEIWCSIHEEWMTEEDECLNCVIEAEHEQYRIERQAGLDHPA